MIFALMALSDFPPLVKGKKWYELGFLCFLYVFIFTLAVLQTFGTPAPSPMPPIQKFLAETLKLSYPKQ